MPCQHDDPQLPEIRRFASLLAEARQAEPSAPEPVVPGPGEALALEEGGAKRQTGA